MVNRDTLSPIVSTHASKRVHQSSVGKSCPLGQLDHVIANGHVVNIVRSDSPGVDLQRADQRSTRRVRLRALADFNDRKMISCQ